MKVEVHLNKQAKHTCCVIAFIQLMICGLLLAPGVVLVLAALAVLWLLLLYDGEGHANSDDHIARADDGNSGSS